MARSSLKAGNPSQLELVPNCLGSWYLPGDRTQCKGQQLSSAFQSTIYISVTPQLTAPGFKLMTLVS